MKYTILVALLLSTATVSSIQIKSVEEPAKEEGKKDEKAAAPNNNIGSLEEDPALDAAYYRPFTSQGHIMHNREHFIPKGYPWQNTFAQKAGIEDESYDSHFDSLANSIKSTHDSAQAKRVNAVGREQASNVWRGVKDAKVFSPEW